MNFVILQVKTVSKDPNLLGYFGPIMWNSIPNEIKYTDSLDDLNVKVGGNGNSVLVPVDYPKTLALKLDF